MDEYIINETDIPLQELEMMEQEYGYEEQGSEGWLLERLGNATASEIWKVVIWTKGSANTPPKPTANWYSYKYEIVAERLTKRYKRFKKSKPMEWGSDHESDAALEYERITETATVSVGFVKHPTLALGASLDKEVEENGALEVKCPNTDTAIRYVAEGIPDNYRAQMHCQMFVCDKSWVDFAVFDPYLGDMLIKRLERDDKYLQEIFVPRVTQFLREVDELEATMRELGYAKEEQ